MNRPRILIADDDPQYLHFVSELLIGAGYDVHCTNEPLRIVEMAVALAPDLVVLDVAMPGKNGFEVALEMRANPKLKAVRCMFLTGHRAATQVRDAKEAGGVAYLEKPVKSSTLLWMVKALLSKRGNSGGS